MINPDLCDWKEGGWVAKNRRLLNVFIFKL